MVNDYERGRRRLPDPMRSSERQTTTGYVAHVVGLIFGVAVFLWLVIPEPLTYEVERDGVCIERREIGFRLPGKDGPVLLFPLAVSEEPCDTEQVQR